MSQAHIVEKLNKFFNDHPALNEECQVVYILVEARKLLEITNDRRIFPILNFYADWTLHPNKSRNMEAIKLIAQDMYEAAKKKILLHPLGWSDTEKDALFKFAYMDQLREELKNVFQRHGINESFTEFGSWTPFLVLLIKVLEEQPIIDPIPEIREISFQPAAHRCCFIRVEFSTPVESRGESYGWFELKNAY